MQAPEFSKFGGFSSPLNNKFIIKRIVVKNDINMLLKTLMKKYFSFIVGNCGEMCNFEANMLI